jgi:hypothetical protein
MQRLCHSGGNSSKGEDKDEAMSASPNGKGKRTDKKPRGTCWNCGDKGHYKDKCTKPAKPSDDKKNNSPKKSDTANAAVEINSESETTFFVDEFLDSELPQLVSAIDSDTDDESISDCESGWFSEIDDNSEIGNKDNELPETDESDACSLVSVDSTPVAADLEDAHCQDWFI